MKAVLVVLVSLACLFASANAIKATLWLYNAACGNAPWCSCWTDAGEYAGGLNWIGRDQCGEHDDCDSDHCNATYPDKGPTFSSSCDGIGQSDGSFHVPNDTCVAISKYYSLHIVCSAFEADADYTFELFATNNCSGSVVPLYGHGDSCVLGREATELGMKVPKSLVVMCQGGAFMTTVSTLVTLALIVLSVLF
eukprot:TRINITY_DN6287_c0_g1_i1.p1 TRINITY_DN6287_c0_g1~~TRINITY_DN6287_c0_g1_i1.p1  ORF type:complete len:203 (+),score=19.80 TRINITY_DN6287_c0_g1_i1:30-611(+)